MYDHIWDTTHVRPYMGYNSCTTIYGIHLIYDHITHVRPYMGYNSCTTICGIQLMHDHMWNTTDVRPYMEYNTREKGRSES